MFDEILRVYRLWDLDRKIRKHGWTAIYLAGDLEDGSTSYSIGFQDSLGEPEIVTFGADMQTANSLLWTAYDGLKSGELVIIDGADWDLGWGPLPKLVWRRVHPSQIRARYFGFAILRAARTRPRESPVEGWQLVFSDAGGHMPWEAQFDIDYRPQQPTLWEPYSGPLDEY